MSYANLESQLGQLKAINDAAVALQHGINNETEEWKFFQPTQFVYSFFSFNSLYSIDWNKTLQVGSVTVWPLNGQEYVSESDKIEKLLYFILSTYKHDFYRLLKSKLQRLSPMFKDVKILNEQLDNIRPNVYINEGKKTDYIAEVNNIMLGEALEVNLEQITDEPIYKILTFIYEVKNNLFDGSKHITDMIELEQNERLRIYTKFLIVINDLLFDVVRMKTGIHYPVSQSNLRAVSSNRFQKNLEFKYEVPRGMLFYPGAGTDHAEIEKTFSKFVDHFYYVDSNPKMYRNTASNDFRVFHDNFSNSVKQYLSFLGLKSFTLDVQQGSYQEAVLNHGTKEIKITKHTQDGLVVFSSIDKMSIFMTRGENENEVGSIQNWFDSYLFNYVLDKLEDQGLIITDGANSTRSKQHPNSQYKEMFKYADKNNVEVVDVEDFEYYDRKFHYVGRLNDKSGPTLVWQVKRLNTEEKKA